MASNCPYWDTQHPIPFLTILWYYFVVLQSLSHVWLFATPQTVACQPPPSMGFPRQEYRSGSPFPSPGDLPDHKHWTHISRTAGKFFTTEPPGKLCDIIMFFFFPPESINEAHIELFFKEKRGKRSISLLKRLKKSHRLCQKGLVVQNGCGLLLAEAGRGPHRPCEAWVLYSCRNSSNHLCLVIKVPFLYVKMMCGQKCLYCVCGEREEKEEKRKRKRERNNIYIWMGLANISYLKIFLRVIVWSCNPIPEYVSGENSNLKRYTHPYINRITIYNRQDMEAT